MEEKSIDQLRREAQELYQAKLQAYLQAQNQSPKEPEKPRQELQPKQIQKPKEVIKPIDVIRPIEEIIQKQREKPLKEAEQRNSWFVVSIFLIVLLVVLIELFLFAPGR